MTYLLLFAVALAAYLIGGINFAVIFAKLFTHEDVRDHGSGNAGTTNVMRTAGLLPGILTFVCDVLKGAAGCLVGKLVFTYVTSGIADWMHPTYAAYLCGVCCMLGHMYPAFFQFKGGKGVAMSVGIFSVCTPFWVALIALAVFFLFAFTTKIVSLSSLIATFAVFVLSIIFRDTTANIIPQIIMCFMMCSFVYLKHIPNIKRLLKGEEKKFSLGGKK